MNPVSYTHLVSEDATKDLDANGIIRIGANVHPGDILIGKITPKGDSDPSPCLLYTSVLGGFGR